MPHEGFSTHTPLTRMREEFPHAMSDAEITAKEFAPVITERALRDLCSGDEVLEGLLDEVIEYSCRYAEDVIRMHEFALSGKLASGDHAEEYAALDDARTRLHTATMESFNILSRALARAGRDNSWRALVLDRAAAGALAVQLGLLHYLEMEPIYGDDHVAERDAA